MTGDDCSADAVLADDGELYLHVSNGGSTFETFNVDDDSAGAIVGLIPPRHHFGDILEWRFLQWHGHLVETRVETKAQTKT